MNEATGSTRRRAIWLSVGAVVTVAALIVGVLGVATVWAVVRGSDTSTTSHSDRYSRDVSELAVNTTVGDIRVEGHDADRMDLRRELSWSRKKPVIDETWNGDALSVEAFCPNPELPWLNQGCGIGYIATLPNTADVTVETTTGDLALRSIDGTVDARTTTADVHAEDLGGHASLRASTGDVTATRLRSSNVDAEATTGSVDLEFAVSPERIEATTSTGDVTIEVPRGEVYRVNTPDGTGAESIDIAQDPRAARVIEARASTGDVRIRYR